MESRRWASSAPQPRASGAETHVPLGVRAAVEHGVAHPLQRGAVGLVQSSDDPGDATHRLVSRFPNSNRRTLANP